jgi:hypothetical protein
MNFFQFKLRFYKNLIFIAVNTFILIIIIFSIFIIILHVRKYNENSRNLAKLGSSKDEPIIFGKPRDGCIKIAVTCCGEDIIEQTLIMIKSALISTNCSIHFIIFADYVKSAINESVKFVFYLFGKQKKFLILRLKMRFFKYYYFIDPRVA